MIRFFIRCTCEIRHYLNAEADKMFWNKLWIRMLCIQRILTVSELAAEGTKIPDITVTRGLHGYSLYGFLHLKIEYSNIF